MAKGAKTQGVSSAPPTSFEGALAELETIVGGMEEGELPLEQSLAAYKRGAELLKYCQTQLAEVQRQIKVLEGDTLKPFTGVDAPD